MKTTIIDAPTLRCSLFTQDLLGGTELQFEFQLIRSGVDKQINRSAGIMTDREPSVMELEIITLL